MTEIQILLIEDEESLASFIQTELELEGYQVTWADNGQTGLEIFQAAPERFTLILLDWMLPGYDGLTVARRIRKGSDIPIIMMTARDQTSDVIAGLDTGLDDYLTKPFDIEELFARIRVVLRRLEKFQVKQVLTYKALRLDIAKHEVIYDGQVIELTPKEFGILYELMRSPEEVKTREELLNEVWGYDFFGQTNTVDVYIRNLRNKLGKVGGEWIKTIRGVGYTLRADDE